MQAIYRSAEALRHPKTSATSTRSVSLCPFLIIIFRCAGWRRKNGRARVTVFSFLDFHIGEQHRRRGCGYRNAAGFSSANAVEDAGSVSGGGDPRQHRERGADDIDTADQFIGTPIRVNAPDHDGQNLERLRKIARGQSESALDVFEVEAVRLSLLLDFFDEAGAKLDVGNRFRRSNNQ